MDVVRIIKRIKYFFIIKIINMLFLLVKNKMKNTFNIQIKQLTLFLIFIILAKQATTMKFKSPNININVFDIFNSTPSSSSSVFSHIDTHYEANFLIKPNLIITDCSLLTDAMLCVNKFYCAWDNIISKCVDSAQNQISHKDNKKIYFTHN